MKMVLALTGFLAASSIAVAQDHSGHGAAADRPAAATSEATTACYTARERSEGLRQGRGMGLATPAEANGYPGPRHVLELAAQIDLTPAQRARTEVLFAAMEAEAQRLGVQLLAGEAELDSIFRERRANPARVEAAARRIGETEAALKVAHLRTHLAMTEILTPEQVARYVALRGGGAGSGRTRPAADAGAAGHDH